MGEKGSKRTRVDARPRVLARVREYLPPSLHPSLPSRLSPSLPTSLPLSFPLPLPLPLSHPLSLPLPLLRAIPPPPLSLTHTHTHGIRGGVTGFGAASTPAFGAPTGGFGAPAASGGFGASALPATSAGSAFGSNSSVFGGGGASAFAASTSAPAAPAFGNPRSPPPPPPVLLRMPNAVAWEREKAHRREAPLYCKSTRMLLYEHHARLTTVSARLSRRRCSCCGIWWVWRLWGERNRAAGIWSRRRWRWLNLRRGRRVNVCGRRGAQRFRCPQVFGRQGPRSRQEVRHICPFACPVAERLLPATQLLRHWQGV